MTSVRSILNCIGVTATRVALLSSLFGFSRGQMPTDPDSSVTAQVSVLEKIRDVQGQHIHLNVIRVGFDAIAGDTARDRARERADYAVYRIHRIFRQVNLGIGRVEHYVISAAEADGRDDLGSSSDARDLWRSFSVPNDGLDVFVVRTISGNFVGISPVGGSCSKGSKRGGLIGGRINRGDEGVARTFAHEVGHFLGLDHNHGDDCPSSDAARRRLMAQTRCVPDIRDSVTLISSEGTTMRGHCSVQEGC
jgi:hypothetical protein